MYYTGLAYQSMGKSDSASECFHKLLKISYQFNEKDTLRENYFPVGVHAMYNLARIYLNTHRQDDAERVIKEIIGEYNNFGPAFRLLGNLYQSKGDLKLSKYYIDRANDLVVDVIPPVDTLVDKIILLSRSELYLLKQIDLAVRSQNYKWATVLCDHAFKYLPDDKFVISKTLKNRLHMGLVRQAIPLIEKHLEYFAEDYDELIEIAGLLFDSGFNPKAMEYFALAKKLRPDFFNLPVWLHSRGLTNEAIPLINEQLKAKPEDILVLSAAILIFTDAGKMDTAEHYFMKLKKLAPLHTNVLKFSGLFAEKDGRLKEAIAFYEKVVKNDQKDAHIIQKLENYYIYNQWWDKLSDLYFRTLEGNPNQPYLQVRLGLACYWIVSVN